MQKKTLIITLEYPPQVGGIATYIHDLAMEMDPVQTIVLAPTSKGSDEWDATVPYKVIRKKLLFPSYLWPRWLRVSWHTLRIARKERVEILMAHHVLPIGYVAVLTQWFLKTPFLLFSHGTDLLMGTKNVWKRTLVAFVSARAQQIVFNSHSLKRRYLEHFPQFLEKTLVLYPCPSPDLRVRPSDETLTALSEQYGLSGKRVLLSVGRLDEGKGFTHLLRMIPELIKKIPYLTWVVIGDGPKKGEFISHIQKHHLENVVRFVGEVPHNKLKPWYYIADVFALLTHPDEGREEGLGLVFLEASAVGCPIVAGKSGGVEEGILHSETGLIVDIHKGDQFVIDAIAGLFENHEYAKRLGRQARERMESDFVWSHQVEKLQTWIG